MAQSLTASPSTGGQSTFSWPSLYSFPPFFTPQPHVETAAAQLDAWTSLILSYAREHRAFYVDLTEAPPAEGEQGAGGLTLGSDLFYNHTINRRVHPSFARTIASRLVQSGLAAWDDGRGPVPVGKAKGDSSRFWIYWRRPEEWAEIIYLWVKETGQNKSIMTLFELTEGPNVQNTKHRNLPLPLLHAALSELTKTGRAQVFSAEQGLSGGEGVKFV